MRKRPRRGMPKWAGALLIVAFMLIIPLWLPMAAFMWATHNRKLRKTAASFICLNCCNTLGKNAIKLADDEWAAYVRKLRRSNPGVRMRLVKSFDAICPSCGAKYSFNEKEQSFAPELATSKPPSV